MLFVFGFFFMALPNDAHASSSSLDWWWVFYESEKSDKGSIKVIRPFYLANVPSDGKAFYASLMPIVWWAYETPRSYEWQSLIGFIHSVDYTHRDGVRDYDFGLFPFLFFGTSPDERDRYCMIWPFGGTIKGKLGQDRITAYLFPGVMLFFLFPPTFPPALITTAVLIASFIPLYVEYQSRDYHAWGILWPLVQRGISESRDDFRLLPFYAHNYKRGAYDNYSFLLLINYSTVFMKHDEQHTFFFLPFYGRRWNTSGRAEGSTLLWPFFSWGFNQRTGSFELNFPWPLVQIQDSESPRIHKRIFFPFYGRYRYEERESLFVTPLYFSLKTETKNFRSEYHITSLIFWYFTREYKDRPSPRYGSRWKYIKLWPLFQYEEDDRGTVSFTTLSLLPWRDPDGYERLYQPFWTLFEYRRLQDGERRMGLLLRLYYQRWNDNFFFMKIPLLLSYGSEHGRVSELSFFLSMFSYERGDGGTRFRVFWIPFGASDPFLRGAIAGDDQSVSDYSSVPLVSLSQQWNTSAYTSDGYHYCPGHLGFSMQVF